jgi:cytoskeletal protein RodZ
MSEPRPPFGPGSGQPQWSQPTEPLGNQYPGSADPAYGGTYNYPGYLPPNTSDPTRALPAYWTQTQYPQYAEGPQQPAPPPPPPPKSPRWLWLAAATAIVLVLGLVAALLIANGAQRDDTVVAPLPPLPDTTTSRPTSPLPTMTAPTPTTVAPRPTTTSAPEAAPPRAGTTPPTSTDSAATESVVYSVSGEGRAISITYVDTGGVLQMQFNVVLPWSREVTLSPSTVKAASVTVVNVGRQVSCSVTVNGVEVQQRSGNGLTICASRR